MSYKKIVMVLSVIIAASGAGYGIYQSNRSNPPEVPGTASQDEAEKNNVENQPSENKAQIEDSTKPSGSNSNDTIKIVTPVITSSEVYGSNLEVAARVPGINESGGTCKLTLTKGSKVVVATQKGVSNVTEVSCGYISIPKSKLSSGVWSATVSYSSAEAKGSSEPKNIKV